MTDKRDGPPRVARRQWLALASGSLSAALAGCLGSGSSSGDDDNSGDTGAPDDDPAGDDESEPANGGDGGGRGDDGSEPSNGDGSGDGGDDGDDSSDGSDDGDDENGTGDDDGDGSDDGTDDGEQELLELEITVYSKSKSEEHLAESGELFVIDSDGVPAVQHFFEDGPTASFFSLPPDTYTLQTMNLNDDPLLDGSAEIVLEENTTTDFVTVGHEFPGADSYRFTLYEYRVNRDPDPDVVVQNDQFFGFGTTAANGERFLMYDGKGGSPQHINPEGSPLPWGTDFTEVDLKPFALNTRQQVTEGNTTYHRRVTDPTDFPDWEVLDHFNGHIRWTDELSRFQVVDQGLYQYIHDGIGGFDKNHGEIELNGRELHKYEISGTESGERVYLDPDTGHVCRWELEGAPKQIDQASGTWTEEIRLAIVEFSHRDEFNTLYDEAFNFDSGFGFELEDARSV